MCVRASAYECFKGATKLDYYVFISSIANILTPNQNKSYKRRNLKFDCFFFLKKQEKTVEGLNEDSKKEKVIRITMEKRRSCKSARVSSHSG